MEAVIKKIGVFLASIILILGMLYYLVVNYSTTTYYLKCNGELIRSNDEKVNEIIYLKIEKYSSWVHLWSESDGNIIANGGHLYRHYFGNIQIDNISISIHGSDNSIDGQYTIPSDKIWLSTVNGHYRGVCKKHTPELKI